jgi:hypothetical protein
MSCAYPPLLWGSLSDGRILLSVDVSTVALVLQTKTPTLYLHKYFEIPLEIIIRFWIVTLFLKVAKECLKAWVSALTLTW